jgi:hypothetical protein
MDELERAILVAHASGDTNRLEALQARYRAEVGSGLRILERPGPTPVVTGSSPPKSSGNGTPARVSDPKIIGIRPSALRVINGYERGDEGLETGGWLFGVVGDSAIFVDYAAESGPRAERAPTSMRLDGDEMRELEDAFGRSCIGDWHLHPHERDIEPSRTDQDHWGSLAGTFGHPWAAIIIGDNGSPYWPKRAFITKFHGGRPRTYPAALVEEEI